MASSPRILVWFRQDLRLADNPALYAAAKKGVVLPVYIVDDQDAGDWRMGAASRCWLQQALKALDATLDGTLCIQAGKAKTILRELVRRERIDAVYWNRCYEPWRQQRDTAIRQELKTEQVEVRSFNGSLLWEPWEVLKNDGTPYRVFTPFYKKGCLGAGEPRTPLPAPKPLRLIRAKKKNMSPRVPDPAVRDIALHTHWNISEEGARKALATFIKTGLDDYRRGRDFPALAHVSRLSPYLRSGQISPHQVWYAARAGGEHANTDHFCRELGWREFSYHLLYHFPRLPSENLKPRFDAFPWTREKKTLEAWQQGRTGIPVVDAGMRELWQTGYMHNRIRMIAASFLVKNLLLDWRLGAAWFWDCLADADLASNSASWQWVAGCGADAAPFFRIFNPVIQGKKFDPQGLYTRRYVPELSALPDNHLFAPWEAPKSVLATAGVQLDVTYPAPVIDLKASRERALKAFQALRQG